MSTVTVVIQFEFRLVRPCNTGSHSGNQEGMGGGGKLRNEPGKPLRRGPCSSALEV